MDFILRYGGRKFISFGDRSFSYFGLVRILLVLGILSSSTACADWSNNNPNKKNDEPIPAQSGTVSPTHVSTDVVTSLESTPLEATKEPVIIQTSTVTPQDFQSLPDLTGEITLWHSYETGTLQETALLKVIKNAQQTFPELTLQVLQTPSMEITRAYYIEAMSGSGPDVFLAPNNDLLSLVRQDLLLGLDEYFLNEFNEVPEFILDGMKVNGSLYGIPKSIGSVALYYNKSLINIPPESTDELLHMVEDGNLLVSSMSVYHLFGWVSAFGGRLFDENYRCVADLGGWVEFLNYLISLQEAGAIFITDYAEAERIFMGAGAAMFINGPWALEAYSEVFGDNLGVVPLPAGPIGPAQPFSSMDGFYVNPNSPNIEAAVELIKFLVNKESSQIYTDMAGDVPVRSDVIPGEPMIVAFQDASGYSLPQPQTEEFINFWAPFGDLISNVLNGSISPEQGVIEACAAMNAANNK
jgi:arabinogalactan oligomer/maltooligosaccharide transport system substrate-binding protein